MGIKIKLEVLCDILKLQLFSKRTPIAVRWQLTYKCPLRCMYCDIWKNNDVPELETKQILPLLDEMKECGVKKISFSGGEPMLRKDIDKIIDHCLSDGISPEINSTGFLVPQKINQLKNLHLLKLSLDGPKEIHDLVRGKAGSYDTVMRAAESAAANGIKFIFTATLTKFNINEVEFLLDLAEKFNTFVAFQPLKKRYSASAGETVEGLYPCEEEYKNALKKLISSKKSGKGRMRNSLQGLLHIYNWPNYEKLDCNAGKLFCMIEPSGILSPCDRLKYNRPLPNCAELGFKKSFNSLPGIQCDGCGFCGSLELNYLASFKWGIIPTLNKIMER